MANTMNRWETIREGASDVERLIGQKHYNLAMIKARQTLEIMVGALADSYGVQQADLRTMIDELHRIGALSDTSAERYHQIRMIGNKATHEADDNPSGANAAYHLLSQELYTFARDYGNQKPVRRTRPSSRGYDDTGRVRTKKRKKRSGIKEIVFIAFALILAGLLIFGIIRLIGSNKDKEKENESETELQIAVETAPEIYETVAVTESETEPLTEAPKQYVISANTVNIREEPNTDCRILTQLHRGDPVYIIENVDVEWARIDLDGTEAYVNRQFIEEASTEDAGPEGDQAEEAEQ